MKKPSFSAMEWERGQKQLISLPEKLVLTFFWSRRAKNPCRKM